MNDGVLTEHEHQKPDSHRHRVRHDAAVTFGKSVNQTLAVILRKQVNAFKPTEVVDGVVDAGADADIGDDGGCRIQTDSQQPHHGKIEENSDTDRNGNQQSDGKGFEDDRNEDKNRNNGADQRSDLSGNNQTAVFDLDVISGEFVSRRAFGNVFASGRVVSQFKQNRVEPIGEFLHFNSIAVAETNQDVGFPTVCGHVFTHFVFRNLVGVFQCIDEPLRVKTAFGKRKFFRLLFVENIVQVLNITGVRGDKGNAFSKTR